MSYLTYIPGHVTERQTIDLAQGRSEESATFGTGRIEAGFLLRRLQQGERLSLPQSRPMPSIGHRCHELRIQDEGGTWRIVYRLDRVAIVIAEVFQKKTQATPRDVIENCTRRFRQYDELNHE